VAGMPGQWHPRALAPAESSIDLGEGIAQSLRADCLLLAPSRQALAQGVATLEVRDQAWLSSGPDRSFTNQPVF
jgi:hypothetical protein